MVRRRPTMPSASRTSIGSGTTIPRLRRGKGRPVERASERTRAVCFRDRSALRLRTGSAVRFAAGTGVRSARVHGRDFDSAHCSTARRGHASLGGGPTQRGEGERLVNGASGSVTPASRAGTGPLRAWCVAYRSRQPAPDCVTACRPPPRPRVSPLALSGENWRAAIEPRPRSGSRESQLRRAFEHLLRAIGVPRRRRNPPRQR